MRKVVYYIACGLIFGGGFILVAASTYAAWLFWTDSFWTFAKIMGIVMASGLIVAVIGNAMFEYAERKQTND